MARKKDGKKTGRFVFNSLKEFAKEIDVTAERVWQWNHRLPHKSYIKFLKDGQVVIDVDHFAITLGWSKEKMRKAVQKNKPFSL